MLIYGEPGVGKTRLVGTAQDTEETLPLLILDVEGGVTTLRRKQEIDVLPVRSMEDVLRIHKDLHNSIEGEGTEKHMYYKTVAIDSLTELQKLDMRFIMAELVQRRPDLDPDVPSPREWQKSQEHIRRIVRGFRDLPCNVLFTCHSATVKDESTNLTMIFPDLPGKMRTQVAGFLDIVGYMYTAVDGDNVIRKIQFAKTRTLIAKDRTDSLGDVVDEPTIPLLWSKINA